MDVEKSNINSQPQAGDPRMNEPIAALELGGTKTVAAIGDNHGNLLEEFRYPTTTPQDTIEIAIEWWNQRANFSRLGIASFGPIRLDSAATDYGTFLTTPKLPWIGFSLTGYLRNRLPQVRVTLATDVQAALRAEMKCGIARGMQDAIYFTVGTGIGAGIACHGQLVQGTLHPEMGHIMVRRHADDRFEGICPYHADCWEGLASGPAIEKRWGIAAQELPHDHPAWEMEAYYLAQGLYTASAMLAPQCLILGGGVSQTPGLLERVASHLDALAGGYFNQLGQRVVAPALGQRAGVMGALMLAKQSVFPICCRGDTLPQQ